ncbi:isotrichodermin C-15 hydroxylase [Xylariales sp. AK1849]|nr:isotrichodermin C-15 hydroxylase [Xylariales sp. AK1849]
MVIWQVTTVVYNLYFHPLRDFPGPLLSRASSVPFAIQHASGVQAFRTQKLHERYGSIVRIGPSHLSFTDVRAWKDIYGHRVGSGSSVVEMPKASTFSNVIRGIPTSIINAGREEHQRLRRALAHGFSDTSMRQQEPLIVKYVDLLIQRLHDGCDGGKKAQNLEAWYNWTTFDVVGDLVFGKSFGCLQDAEYHPWVAFIFRSVRFGSVAVALKYAGFDIVVQILFKSRLFAITKMRNYIDELLQGRLEAKEDRNDLFEGIVKRQEEWNLSFQKLASNAFILVLAGSETTATTLSGATYLLLTHPDVLKRLNEEVRTAFGSADEININSVNKLSYMLAVLNESLRLYPPVTSSLVRSVPGTGEEIAGKFIPGGTYVEVQHWSMNHSKENWKGPWTFDPTRFLADPKEASELGNRLDALQSFNVGPRNCIGRNLAYSEMRLILARIIYDFDMELLDDSQHWIEKQKAYPLWDRKPLNVYLTPVDARNEARN